jgi:hypothetical protein
LFTTSVSFAQLVTLVLEVILLPILLVLELLTQLKDLPLAKTLLLVLSLLVVEILALPSAQWELTQTLVTPLAVPQTVRQDMSVQIPQPKLLVFLLTTPIQTESSTVWSALLAMIAIPTPHPHVVVVSTTRKALVLVARPQPVVTSFHPSKWNMWSAQPV